MNENKIQIIASVTALKGTQNCLVTLENEEFFQCSKDLVLKYKLARGTPLDADLLKAITDEQRIYDVKQAAYNYASYKPRTTKQVVTKLRQKDFTTEEVTQAVAFLSEFNLLDDIKYAKSFVVEYVKRKPAGKYFIQRELMKRGIPKVLADETIANYFPEEDMIDLAVKSVEKKLRMIPGSPRKTKRTIIIAYLKRQGFDWEIIKRVVEEYFPRH